MLDGYYYTVEYFETLTKSMSFYYDFNVNDNYTASRLAYGYFLMLWDHKNLAYYRPTMEDIDRCVRRAICDLCNMKEAFESSLTND